MMPGPNGSQRRRWVQTVFVIRGDAIAAHTTDYGPAENFEEVTPLMMPSFGDDTVAQLREHAEKNRHDRYWSNRRKEMLAESTLIQDAIIQRERNREYIRNRSALGPYIAVERNVYSRDHAQRKLKERTNGS